MLLEGFILERNMEQLVIGGMIESFMGCVRYKWDISNFL